MISEGLTPQENAADALHIAVTVVHGNDYLLTWNCKHIANAAHRHKIAFVIEAAGYACPIICPPEELMED